jgi:hypothetical protein
MVGLLVRAPLFSLRRASETSLFTARASRLGAAIAGLFPGGGQRRWTGTLQAYQM